MVAHLPEIILRSSSLWLFERRSLQHAGSISLSSEVRATAAMSNSEKHPQVETDLKNNCVPFATTVTRCVAVPWCLILFRTRMLLRR